MEKIIVKSPDIQRKVKKIQAQIEVDVAYSL